MKKELLPQNVHWYKAGLHNHTTVSDGKLTPEKSRDAYKAQGYHILAHTDHSVMVAHQDLNQEDFLMLTGVEIDMEEEGGPCRPAPQPPPVPAGQGPQYAMGALQGSLPHSCQCALRKGLRLRQSVPGIRL